MGIQKPEIREVEVIRYVQPFREGGSLPGLVDADDDFSYVIKFRGAGQGKKALVAELIGGELARVLDLRMPELVFANLDESLWRLEADEEIQDLLKFSIGKNLGVHFLNGAITYDPNVDIINVEEASKVVWLDAWLMNVDRTARNTNMLIWKNELWLIDHGASLYFHHSWGNWEDYIDKPFLQIKEHVLLKQASQVEEINDKYSALFSPETIKGILEIIPDEWLVEEGRELTPNEVREVYFQFLVRRLANSNVFLNQIANERKNIV
jgi:hypothetical protein